MIYLADMSKCTPAAALSERPKPNHWRMVPYESAEVSGTLLAAAPLTRAPDVTLPLAATGWHAVSVGYWYPQFSGAERVALKVKLSGDPCFITIADNEQDALNVTTLRETFWKYADLTGQEIVFGQQSKGIAYPAYVAYVKLEPLSDPQVEQIQADRADRSKKILIGSNDGGCVGAKGITTEEEIREQLEVYRDTDMGRLHWAVCYGDTTNYVSKVGWNYNQQADRYAEQYANSYLDSVAELEAKGIVAHKVAMDHAHSMGIEFYVMFRLGMGGYPAPMDAEGGLCHDRPDLRQIDRDGTPLSKLSYAFPEVRQRMLDIIAEVTDDDELDGIDLCWIRGAPFIGYEKPVAEAFRSRYGQEATEVAVDDPRLCQLRAEYLTDFMRQVRKITNAVADRRGRPLAVSAMPLGGTLAQNVYRGYDTDTWVNEGLVDELMAAPLHTRFFHANSVREVLYVGPDGRNYYMQAVRRMANSGADGIFVWDITGPQDLANHWALLRRLGHTTELLELEGKGALPAVKRIPLKSVNGMDTEHTYHWGNVEGQALIFYTNG